MSNLFNATSERERERERQRESLLAQTLNNFMQK